MTATAPSRVLAAVTRVAVEATGAGRGRLVIAAAGGDGLQVVAAHGGDSTWQAAGADRIESGIAGYVMATGQPQVVTHESQPVLCVPCARDDDVVGALELVEKSGGGSFSIDDLELAGLLGGIAGVALAGGRRHARAPAPARLAADLTRLAAADGARYATIAGLVRSLLDG